MKSGQCKLCLREGMDLQLSHGVPAGIYRILRDDNAKNPHPWLVTEDRAVQTSKQLTAPLLCHDCEQRLSENGENWVLANCLKKDGGFRLASILNSRAPDVSSSTNPTRVYWAAGIPEIDRSALAYFAASIFWRGSIYGWNRDGSLPVKLGPFQESFRKYLMGEAGFPRDSVLLLAVREGKETDRLMYFPIGERRGDMHIYKFPMPGLGFGLAVSKNIPARLRGNCFVHGSGNPLVVTPLIEKWLMKDAARLWPKHAVGA